MRKILAAIILSLSCFIAAAQIDSLVIAQAMELLEQYMVTLDPETPQVKSREVDFIIETCTDSLLRQAVAERLYDHYVTSSVMGDEEVAIHIYDRWYKPHLIEMTWDGGLLNAAYFAEYNRQSLIGNKAPQLIMKDRYDEEVPMPDLQGDARAVLFFYDTDCYKCRAELEKLKEYLPTLEIPLDFYAVYTGIRKERWEYFIDTEWDINSAYVKIHHMWDKTLESDFGRAYGITETPRMFLLGKDGTILGRRLNTEALSQLLDQAVFQEALYNKCPIGTKVPAMRVKGIMVKGDKVKEGKFCLRKADYVMFYSPTCSHCQDEISHCGDIAGKKLLIDMDSLGETDPDKLYKLLETFDLSSLPHIISLEKGRVTGKYLTFIE